MNLAATLGVTLLLGLAGVAALPLVALHKADPAAADDLPRLRDMTPAAGDHDAAADIDPPASMSGLVTDNGTGEPEGEGVEGPSTPEADSAGRAPIRENETFTGGNASTRRVLAITAEDAAPREPWKAFDGDPLKTFDIDGDGDQEIIAQNDNHWVYVFDAKTGALLAELRGTLPSYWGARTFNGPEAAVLERGGATHIVLANSAAVVTAFRFDAAASTPDSFRFDKVWELRLDLCHEDPGMDAKVVVVDLDYDGRMEVLAATEERGLYALRHDGSLYWHNCLSGGNAAPTVADVTGDGRLDVVHVSDGGIVALLDGQDGEWIWGYDILADFELGSGSITVSPAVGDLVPGRGLEIVVGARDSHDARHWDEDHALLLALDSQGQVLWARQEPGGNPLTYTRPIIADADADGENEVYWADWNTIGHNPPRPDSALAWDRTGPANFYRFSAQGDLVWNRTLETWWNNKDIPIADMTGDGLPELLASGPDANGTDGIWYLDVRTGEKSAWVSLAPWKAQRAPVVADLWGTGTTQWVVEAAPVAGDEGPAILVYDAAVPYDAVWPHVPQHSLDASFDASFHAVRGNARWVEVQVQGSGANVAGVAFRVDEGPWQDMRSEGWGWTAAAAVPDGASVRFQATSDRGDTAVSGCYRWPTAEAIPCRGASDAGNTTVGQA